MKLADFIRQNRDALDNIILGEIYRHDGKGGRGTVPEPRPKLNDRERRDWIMNDEGLYRWARREGVKI